MGLGGGVLTWFMGGVDTVEVRPANLKILQKKSENNEKEHKEEKY